MSQKNQAHIVVIGAGVAGATSAALLQQAGYQVTLLEAQTYPGGCASTFTHKGFRFESGATVVGGFQPNGPHAIAGERLSLEWPITPHEPAWVTHLPGRSVALTRDNQDVINKFPASAKFWEQQSRIADIGWSLSAAGLPWPPRDAAELAALIKIGLRRLPDILRVLPFALGTVRQWMRWHGLHRDEAFVRFMDAQLLISAQTTSDRVNALYGATALDLARQGVFHAEGGIGAISETILERFKTLGGELRYRHHVTRISVEDGRVTGVWAKIGRRSKSEQFIPADFVVANTTPWNLETLLGPATPASIRRENKGRKRGWGAFVLHLGVKAEVIPPDFPDHHQIITESSGPLGETRSLFISLSPEWDQSRAPEGQRAMTVTTHTDVQQWWDLLNTDEAAYYARKDDYAARMIKSIESIIPGFSENLTLVLPGTPVTYAFYTERDHGQVGGFPQTSLFKARSPRTGISNLRLVGDSIFPGQSTAGVTLGAMRVVEDIQRHLAPDGGRGLVPAQSTETADANDPDEEVEAVEASR